MKTKIVIMAVITLILGSSIKVNGQCNVAVTKSGNTLSLTGSAPLDKILTFDYTKTTDDTPISTWTPNSNGIQAKAFIMYSSPTVKGVANRLASVTVVEGTSETVYIVGNQYTTSTGDRSIYIIGREVTITNTNGMITYTVVGAQFITRGSSREFESYSYNDLTSTGGGTTNDNNIGYVVDITSAETYRWLDCNNFNAPITGATSSTYTPSTSGSYSVELTVTGSCVDTSVCTAVTICTTNRPAVTKAGTTLSINAIVGASYQWLDCDNANAPLGGASTSEIYRATANGNYAVEVTRSSGCKDTSLCTAVTVCATDRPAVTKAGTTLSINAIVGASYQWLDCDNANAPLGGASTTESYTATANGNYAVEVTRSSGCKDTSLCTAVTVCATDRPAVTKAGTTLSINAIVGASYQWLDCDNANAPLGGASTTESYTATASGNYAVELTRTSGCKDTSLCTAVTVCTTNRPAVTKAGTTLSINAIAGAMYQWLDCDNANAPLGGASTTESYTATTSGNYAVEVTRTSGCKDTSLCTAVTVCTTNRPAVTVAGATLSINTIAGAMYQWLDCDNANAPLGGASTTESYTATASGNYAVEVTRTSGCKDTSVCTAATVNTPCTTDRPAVTVAGATLSINAIAGASYQWLDCDNANAPLGGSSTTESYTATASGNYAVEVTRTSGCKDTSVCTAATVNTPCTTDRPMVTLTGSTLSTNTVNGASFRWLNCDNANSPIGVTTNSFTAALSGSYSVEITRSNGCLDTSICMVACAAGKPQVTKSGTDFLSTSPLAGASYQWLDCDNANTPLGGSTSENYTATASGNYSVEVTSNGGVCKDTSLCTTVTLNTPCTTDRPMVTVAGATLSINTIQGATYQWLDCDNANAPLGGASTTESYTATASGNYAVEVTRTSGCKDTSVCTAATVNTACTTDRPAVTETGVTLSINAIQGATYQWLDCDNANAPLGGASTTESYTPTASGNYAVEVTRSNGCKDTSLCTVFCSSRQDYPTTRTGNTITVNAAMGSTYEWVNCITFAPIPNETSNSYTPTASGSYQVQITTPTGCLDLSACILVCFANKPAVTVAGATLSINATQGETYQWLDCDNANAPLGGASTTESYTATASGNYAVEVTRTSGCKDTSVCTAATVNTPCTTDRPAVTVAGAVLSINAIQGAMYQWLDCDNNNARLGGASTSESYTATASGNYAVEVTRTSGCKDTSLCMAATVGPCTTDRPVVTVAGAVLSINAIQGATYQWLDCDNANARLGGASTSESYTATASGNYAVEVTRTSGCKDTSLCMAATVGPCTTDRPVVTVAGAVLSINAIQGATYQWLDCDNNNAPIMNETNATYTATASGNYSVEVIRTSGCKDTSLCMAATVNTPCTTDRPAVTVAGATLSINAIQGATYQWLDCDNANAPLGGASTSETYTATASGNYAVEVTRTSGCKDTSLCMAATVNTPCVTDRPVVTVAGATLSINVIRGATYQWLRCDNNNAVIAGETNVSYTATVNGMYSVEVTRVNNCKDTSVCMEVKGVGLVENTFATDLKLYPNPTSDNVTIELGNNYSDMVVEITNILGQVVTSRSIPTVTNRKIVLPINASSGIYFVRIQAKEGFASFRVVKK